MLLRLLAEAADPVTIRDMARMSGLPASTVHRLLQVLVDSGMASYHADSKRYGVGMEFIRLSALSMGRMTIAGIARPFMNTVMTECEETCALISFIPGPDQVSAIAVTDSPHPLQYRTELFHARSPLLGATGQAVLAFLPSAEQERIFAAQNGEERLAALCDIPDREAYFARLDAFRQRGFAMTRGETIPGAVGIGAPVRDHRGDVTAALCVTVPEARFSEAVEARVTSTLVPQAAALSAALGFRCGPDH